MNTKIKKISISVGTILFSGLAWFFFSQIFKANSPIEGQSLNWIMFILCIAISYSLLFFVSLARDKVDFFLTSLISVLWILVFIGVDTRSLISAGGLFLFSATMQEFPKALDRSINLRYFVCVYSKSALVIFALLGITSAYLQGYISSTIALDQPQISQQTSNFIWPYVSHYVDQFESDQTVNDYLRSQFTDQGISSPTPQMLSEERQALSQQVGFPVSGNEKMSDVGRKFVAGRINDLMQAFHLQKSGVYVIFFSILILWPIGRGFFGITATLLYYLFRATGLVQVTEAQITAKTLQI